MKNLFKCLTMAMCALLAASAVSAAPIPASTVTTSNEAALPETQEIQTEASVLAEVVPGINMLTGTANPLDFNSGSVKGRTYLDASGNVILKNAANYFEALAVVDSPVSGDTGNKVLKMTFAANARTDWYPDFHATAALPGNGRPVFVSSKGVFTNGDEATSAAFFFAADGKCSGTAIDKRHSMTKYNKADTPTRWEQFYVTDNVSTTACASIMVFFKAPSGITTTTPELYFDDIMYVPYYKVTYYDFDGETVIDSKYVLIDDNGNLLTSYTVDTSLLPEGATHFSTVKGSLDDTVTTVALAHNDINLYAVTDKRITLVNGTAVEKVEVPEDGYTVGTTFKGTEIEDLLLWLDDDGNKYYAGDKLSCDKAKSLTLTAYIQSIDIPAMGMYYEGVETDKYNMDFSAQNGKFADDKEIVDEGRTVAKMSGKAAGAASTPRFAYFAPTAVDANEYKIIDTAFKVDPEGVTGTYSANGVSKFRIYYMPVPGQYIINGANYAAEGLDPEKWSKFIYVPATDTTLQQGYNKYSPYIFNANQKTAFNYTLGEYVKVTWDAEDENLPPYENNNLSIPYGYDGINMGFIVEPYMNAAGPNTDLYLDYFRLYRKGVLEVTYNTNAPAGTTATGEISADTNRGAGTGYVLSTEHPEIEGYDFIGWALNKDAYPNEVVKTIDLTRDTTVYAVWAKKNVPLSYSGNSIRVNEPSGIRFKASLSKTLKNDEKTAEYGFIVTRESFLEDKGMDYLTFEHNDVTYVFGANYKAGTDVDKVYETVDDNVFFTAVIYGIKASEEAYRERLVVRPYIKYDGNTLYGTPMARSIYSVAKSLKDSGYKNLNETEIDYLKGILTVCNEDI